MNKIMVRAERESDFEAVHGVNVLAFGREDEGRIVDQMQTRGLLCSALKSLVFSSLSVLCDLSGN